MILDPLQADELRHLSFQGAQIARPCRRRESRPLLRRSPVVQGPSEEADEPEADGFLRWLLQRAGLDATFYRTSPLERRLPACLRALRVTSTEAARTRLEQHPDLLQTALGSLLLGVTEFFRDPPVFQALRQVLPELARGRDRLRIWSVSCSDGSELYSIAILLAELDLLDHAELVGSDCRAEAIAQAQAGIYPQASLRQIEPSLIQRYFGANGPRFRVREALRQRTRWQVRDLFQHVEEGPWDLVLWRNTAIYLKARAARTAWEQLAEGLRPGGVLVTGKAERPDCAAKMVKLGSCLYRKFKP